MVTFHLTNKIDYIFVVCSYNVYCFNYYNHNVVNNYILLL